jgi:hypothetical protein
MQSSIGLGPFYFARVPLHFEVLVALGSAKSKNLQKGLTVENLMPNFFK